MYIIRHHLRIFLRRSGARRYLTDINTLARRHRVFTVRISYDDIKRLLHIISTSKMRRQCVTHRSLDGRITAAA